MVSKILAEIECSNIMDDNEIEIKILRKFHRHNIWRKHHIREDTLLKGFKGRLKHRVKIIAEDLRKRGMLIKYPTNHGMQWYANRNKIKEIEEILMSNK